MPTKVFLCPEEVSGRQLQPIGDKWYQEYSHDLIFLATAEFLDRTLSDLDAVRVCNRFLLNDNNQQPDFLFSRRTKGRLSEYLMIESLRNGDPSHDAWYRSIRIITDKQADKLCPNLGNDDDDIYSHVYWPRQADLEPLGPEISRELGDFSYHLEVKAYQGALNGLVTATISGLTPEQYEFIDQHPPTGLIYMSSSDLSEYNLIGKTYGDLAHSLQLHDYSRILGY